ncbi:MAG: hypothetical protein HOC71_13470 [Candidatus Latescibacteria bacterium]|jgi:hypothetical protein|nr:hypothetical protein [Candidatus Latescibacterota bacterium]
MSIFSKSGIACFVATIVSLFICSRPYTVYANPQEIQALFERYENAIKQGNVKEALTVFNGSDDKTIKSQTERVNKIKGKIGEIHTNCNISESNWLGWVVIMDKDSQPFDGFRFIAKQNEKDKGWIIKTKEIKNDKTWVDFYSSCAHYFHYWGASYEKERKMCEKIIASYSHVPNAAAGAYRRIGDTYFLESEKSVKQEKINTVSGELKEQYLKAIESFEKGLLQKGIQSSTVKKIKLDLGISYYRIENYAIAEKHLDDIAGSSIGGMRNGKYYKDILQEWIEKVKTAIK